MKRVQRVSASMKRVQRVAALVAVVMFAVALSQPAQAEGVAPAVDGARSGIALEKNAPGETGASKGSLHEQQPSVGTASLRTRFVSTARAMKTRGPAGPR